MTVVRGAGARSIDVHAHFVPSSFPPYAGSSSERRWPSMDHCGCHHARVMIDGTVYREVEDKCWDPTRRCEDMDAMGVEIQAVSPMPELLSYWFSAADGRAMARWMNDQIAECVAARPGRFVGLGMVALQDPAGAARELDYIMDELGFAGVEIGTNVNGKPLGHPDLHPFFEAAAAKGAAIFVHGLHPAGMDRLVGPPALEQIVAFPCETALSISSLITGGTLDRYPGLKLCFSHGGGAFALTLPRLEYAWQSFPVVRATTTRSPTEWARELHYDTLVYDEPALRFLIGQFGVSQLMIGTDYPFAILERDPNGRIEALGLGEREWDALTRGNALRFLGLGSALVS